MAIIKIACPKCREKGEDKSGNNLALMPEGTPPNANCFKCHYHLTGIKFEELLLKTTMQKPTTTPPKPLNPIGDYRDIPTRGLTKATCEFFNYSVSKTPQGEWVQVANFKNPLTGKIDAQKLRTPDKRFYWAGDGKKVDYLFGQWLFNPNPKLSIIVTEGELDCLAYAEATKCKWPVVSITRGSNGAIKELERSAQWLNGFKKIVLCFDGDEAGEKAAIEVASSPKFKHGKIHIATDRKSVV